MYDSKEDTIKHIDNVRIFINELQQHLFDRTNTHDLSKLSEPEKAIFDEVTPKLAKLTYGSEEYKGQLKYMKVALDHHYTENRHHPEHFENGIKDMTLVDLCEMMADWKSATLRHDNGDIYKSLEINQKRFGYSDDMKQIFKNTVKLFD